MVGLQGMAVEIAQAEGIDAALFVRLITQESSWIPDAGADKPFPACVGLGQLNEELGAYFIGLHGKGIVRYYRLANVRAGRFGRYWTDARIRATLLDSRINLTIGARELKRLIRYFGDWQTALAAWNWGSGNVIRLQEEFPLAWMAHLPEETGWMIAKVMLDRALKKYGAR